ncbi:hypothetical protein GOARA_088_00240 [Gordonia araii NBRC 100433]|uniref:Integral membrane protein n=1 Tax=Gordonia araii NBRC 100433 TaxID=1073574 RepID=G7H7D6_9ACTN|nr:hypothetical protein [Gordonia araii]NNG98444.1 hypothetical protein [Gordonia araii NBRC 100433]GAB11761.1 hypothetical protein GOARA_088_00240 [Gordonia araii NBRC 100433]
MTTTQRTPVHSITSAITLRSVLGADAAVSGINGIVYVAAAAVLDSVLGVSAALLVGLGIFLVVWAAALAYAATRETIAPMAVREIAAINLAWVAGSIAALFLLDLTVIGVVWCIAQAIVVTAFAVLALRMVGE